MAQKERYGFVGIVFFIFFLLLSVAPVRAEDETPRVIRVGYPIQAGFSEIDQYGKYSGYTYEYLQEIAQYTNWEYEFITPEGDINEQLVTLLDMLENGEIDILGAISYSDELAEMFAYPGYSYGTAYSTLAVLENNIAFTEFNYATFDNMRVAVVSTAKKENVQLKQFAQVNGFHVEQIFCDSVKEQTALLNSGQADAALGKDVGIDANLRVIARFAPQAVYFALYKDSQDLVSELNRALEMISATNPYFMASLYEKYFDSGAVMVLSSEQQKYVEEVGTLRVAVMLGKAPFQYEDKEGNIKGISVDILDYIAEQTGLQFEIVPFHTQEEYRKALMERTVDIIAGVPNDYGMARAENYTLTIPFAYVPMLLAMNDRNRTDTGASGKIAAVENEYMVSNTSVSPDETVYLDTFEACLDAVHKGKADYCYGDSYSLQYYISSNNYKNINQVGQSDSLSRKYSFGLMKPTDITLLSIMNKALKALPEETVNKFLYNNAYNPNEMSFVEYMARNPEQTTLGLVSFWLLVLIIILVAVQMSRKTQLARKRIENERYEMLSGLSNEFLYEYEIREDALKLTEQTAAFLGCEKDILHPESRKEEYPVFGYMVSREMGSREYQCALPGGRECWLRFISRIVTDLAGRPWFIVGKLVDIQKERDDLEQLEYKAHRDSMTGVYNSATSRQRIQGILEDENRDHQGAMIILDIDYFKRVNDELGHYTGDQVLCDAAKMLRSCFGEKDVIGRLGGDEFVVFVREARDPGFVTDCCRQVLSAMREQSQAKYQRPITLSMGGAMAGDVTDYETLYRIADAALYRVKERGRNDVEVMEA